MTTKIVKVNKKTVLVQVTGKFKVEVLVPLSLAVNGLTVEQIALNHAELKVVGIK